MPHAGQELEGPDGFRLRLVTTAAETDGELLEMEATYSGRGAPPPHLHPRQVEQFEVVEGTVLTVIDGEERRYSAPETFEVPAGTVHQMSADAPARMRWEVRPALRTAEFFERLYTATPEELGRPGAAAEFLAEFADEFRLADAP